MAGNPCHRRASAGTSDFLATFGAGTITPVRTAAIPGVASGNAAAARAHVRHGRVTALGPLVVPPLSTPFLQAAQPVYAPRSRSICNRCDSAGACAGSESSPLGTFGAGTIIDVRNAMPIAAVR